MTSITDRGKREGTEPNIIIGAVGLLGSLALLVVLVLSGRGALSILGAAMTAASCGAILRRALVRRNTP